MANNNRWLQHWLQDEEEIKKIKRANKAAYKEAKDNFWNERIMFTKSSDFFTYSAKRSQVYANHTNALRDYRGELQRERHRVFWYKGRREAVPQMVKNRIVWLKHQIATNYDAVNEIHNEDLAMRKAQLTAYPTDLERIDTPISSVSNDPTTAGSRNSDKEIQEHKQTDTQIKQVKSHTNTMEHKGAAYVHDTYAKDTPVQYKNTLKNHQEQLVGLQKKKQKLELEIKEAALADTAPEH